MNLWFFNPEASMKGVLAAVVAGLFPIVAIGAGMLAEEAKKAAFEQMRATGVVLTIDEPAGTERGSEPVTSGIPLPEGCLRDPGDLVLMSGAKKAVPCQFTPMCRWPDGSLKWVLLDFQADVGASNRANYTLRLGRNAPSPGKPVGVRPIAAPPVAASTNPQISQVQVDPRIAAASRDASSVSNYSVAAFLSGQDSAAGKAECAAVTIETGLLRVGITRESAGLIHSVSLDGRELLSPTNPVQVVLTDGDGQVYRGSKPKRLAIEQNGPMRVTVLEQGELVTESGTNIFGGKVGYDLRISAYAGKPELKLAFTLRNDGWYKYRNESKPRQWLFFRSLGMVAPIAGEKGTASNEMWSVSLPAGEWGLSEGPVSLTQWLKYVGVDNRGYFDIEPERDRARERAAGMERRQEGFYYCVNQGTNQVQFGERTLGWATLSRGGKPVVGAAVRRFWQNFPKAIEADRGKITLWLWPEGGFWPRTQEAYEKRTYQLEGGRHKTAEILLCFGGMDDGAARRFEHPLFARAGTEWYRDTGAVVPLARSGLSSADPERREVFERFDRLQQAKIHMEVGDTAGPEFGIREDRWGKVSIVDLMERCPGVFYGWMNYGDLVWDYGYCSLFYDWPYGMSIQYLRQGDRSFLDVAEDMARHRYDIDQYHVENTDMHLAGFQRFERGEHGNLARQDKKLGRKNWEGNCKGTHTWNRGPLLHWALTGDPRSLEAALQNGRAFHRELYLHNRLSEKDKLPCNEFRFPAWAMENWLALYEYTGDRQYLDWAGEVFTKTLLAMEKDNGARGHIVKDGKQSAQFTGYMVEPVCRLHHLTGRKDALDFLKRVLDWQWAHGKIRGEMRRETYFPLIFIENWDLIGQVREEEIPMCGDPVYGFLLADGYAYLGAALNAREEMEIARKVFRDAIFYTMLDRGCDPKARMPLGYHHGGSPFSSAAKVHAYSTRYGELYLWEEEQLAKARSASQRTVD